MVLTNMLLIHKELIVWSITYYLLAMMHEIEWNYEYKRYCGEKKAFQ